MSDPIVSENPQNVKQTLHLCFACAERFRKRDWHIEWESDLTTAPQECDHCHSTAMLHTAHSPQSELIPQVKQPLQRFEVKLTPVAVIIEWWPWGGEWASYAIVKRQDIVTLNLGPSTVSGGPAWQQPRPAAWVNDLIGALMYAADYAEKLDVMIQDRQRFTTLEVLRTPGEISISSGGITLYFDPANTTVTDERKPKEADDA